MPSLRLFDASVDTVPHFPGSNLLDKCGGYAARTERGDQRNSSNDIKHMTVATIFVWEGARAIEDNTQDEGAHDMEDPEIPGLHWENG